MWEKKIESKNQKLLESFRAYCLSHPEERFWQSLRNWSEYSKIYGAKYNKDVEAEEVQDTFYIE